jgi:hypothetical protein
VGTLAGEGTDLLYGVDGTTIMAGPAYEAALLRYCSPEE